MAWRRSGIDVVGALFIVLSSVQLGAIVVIAKLLTETHLAVPYLLAVRFIAAAFLIVLVLRTRNESIGAAVGERFRLIFIGIGFYGTAAVSYYFALSYGETSALALIVYSYPVFVVVAALAFGQGLPSPMVIAAIVLGLLGVGLIVWTPGSIAVQPLGVGLALLSAVGYAGYLVGWDRLVHRTSAMTASLWTSASAGAALLIITLSMREVRMPQGTEWPLLVALSLLTGSAFYCLFRGIRRLGSVKVSAIGTMEPLSTAALAIAILHDQPTLGIALGAPLILLAAVTATFAQARPETVTGRAG